MDPSETDGAGGLTDRMRAYTEALLRGDPDEVRAFWTAEARVLLPGLDLDGTGLTRFVGGPIEAPDP